MKFNGLVSLGTRKKGESYTSAGLYKGLDKVLRLYNRADIYVTRFYCDNKFKIIFNALDEEWTIEFNYTNPQEHVPDIEHENRVLRERFRVGLYRLPFKVLPKTMI